MKKTLLILATIISFSTFAQEQSDEVAFHNTTLEEYNYMTKGYEIQMESGLDMKKGYTFDELEDINMDGYDFNLKFLSRTDSDQLAGVLVVITSENTGLKEYVAVPVGNDSEIISKYFIKINSFNETLAKAYSKITTIVYNNLIYQAAENAKK